MYCNVHGICAGIRATPALENPSWSYSAGTQVATKAAWGSHQNGNFSGI